MPLAGPLLPGFRPGLMSPMAVSTHDLPLQEVSYQLLLWRVAAS